VKRGEVALKALEDLLAATPDAPAADADPDEVLTRGQALVLAREEILATLVTQLEGETVVLADHPAAADLLERVRDRERGWQAAMAHARHVLGERTQAVRRLQQRSR
jgi:hypothetical protein